MIKILNNFDNFRLKYKTIFLYKIDLLLLITFTLFDIYKVKIYKVKTNRA